MLIGLKSLSNTGVIFESFQEQLIDFILDRTLDPAVRVQAVDTFRRLNCEDVRPFFEKVFKNQDEDTEVRIAAYLRVMQCPNYIVLRGIVHTLEVEEVNQVGSFVWSHLHNLLKSSVPTRVEIQGLLSDKDLKDKFNSDARKFSRNFEGSVFFDEINVGEMFNISLTIFYFYIRW